MTPTPLISIIVPMYNAVRTIEACVNSIIDQTVTDWELILVDNGSTDDTRAIIEQKYSSDTRIHCISVPEKGVSNARNAGLDIAKGQYIAFVDSDDFVDPDYLEILCNGREADLTICGYVVDYLDGHGNLANRLICKSEYVNWKYGDDKIILKSLFENGFVHFCWNKLYRRCIIAENNLCFEPYPINEDFIFTLNYLKFARSILAVNETPYHWINRENESTGVDSLPNNYVQILNNSHILLRFILEEDRIADVIAYLSYELTVYKYFQCYKNRLIPKDCLKIRLLELRANHLFRQSCNTFKPVSLGHKLTHFLIKRGWFKLHYIITHYLLK